MIEIEVEGGTADQLRSIASRLESTLDRAAYILANEGKWEAKSRTKGKLKRSIVVKKRGKGAELSATAPYAGFVEHGRGPIVARPGSFLVFQVAGRTVFAKRVGPQRANPFMKPARDAMEKSSAVETVIAELMRS